MWMVSVSYTHLDVYKRQGMLKELYARGVDECILITDRKFAGADTCATVSYTHLDVYKRQS